MMLLPPKNLSANYNAGSIQITWQIDSTSYSPTEVTVSLNNGETSASWTSPGAPTSYNVPSATVSKFAGTLVTITVAFADSVHGENSIADTTLEVPGSPPPPPPLPPRDIKSLVPKAATINQSNSITVAWTSSSYANGSWTAAGNFLREKWAFSSAVLSDGRLVACGGEYSGSGLPENETNFCEIYHTDESVVCVTLHYNEGKE
jgi:hypothetical protein